MIDILKKTVEMKMVTNIVAGIILFFVLKLFFQWIYELTSIRRIKKANSKVMSLLKPYTSSEIFPAQDTFYAAMGAVASDYHVKYEDLNPISYYFQEFIKEILEDGYIPLDKKVEYTNHLHKQMSVFEEESVNGAIYGSVNSADVKRNTFRGNNLLNISIFFSSLLVALFGRLSGTNDLYEAIGIFLVVAFALLVFIDLGMKKKSYRNIPKILSSMQNRLKQSNLERKERKVQEAKEKEEEQFNQNKINLEEEHEKLKSAQIEFEEKQRKLLEEYACLNDEKKKWFEERKQNEEQMIKEEANEEVAAALAENSGNMQELV